MVHGEMMIIMFTIFSFYPPEMKPDTALLGQDGSPSSPTTSFMGGFGYIVIVTCIEIVDDRHTHIPHHNRHHNHDDDHQ